MSHGYVIIKENVAEIYWTLLVAQARVQVWDTVIDRSLRSCYLQCAFLNDKSKYQVSDGFKRFSWCVKQGSSQEYRGPPSLQKKSDQMTVGELYLFFNDCIKICHVLFMWH